MLLLLQKREDEKAKKEKQTLMDHVERLEASIQELITQRDTNLKVMLSTYVFIEGLYTALHLTGDR